MAIFDANELRAQEGAYEVPLWIDGGPVHSSVGTQPDRAPADDTTLATVHTAGPDDVDRAVDAALRARREWGRMPMRERADRVEELARRIEEDAEAFALLDAIDTGTPIRTMRAGAKKGALYLRACAGVGMELQGRQIPASADGWHVTFHEPFGVVGAIAAFNHPTLFACQKMAAALVAGNTVVLKPAEQTPLAAVRIAMLSEGLLPPGVFNVVPAGIDGSTRLVAHPEVPRITFTGGSPTGIAIQRTAASSGVVKSLTLELGGKNPMLVYPDADVDGAVAALVRGTNFTRVQGQSCGAISRALVPASLYDEIVGRVVAEVESIRLGLPDREETEMGSLVSFAHRDRVLKMIERGSEGDGELLTGGGVPDGPEEIAAGAYVAPTVFGDVSPSNPLFSEEVFGPVLAIVRWDEGDDPLALANAGDYGLAASVWTQDVDRALRVAREIEAGYVWVNDVETRYPGVPFGGWKQSGVGVEQALVEELASFTRTRAINIAVR